MSHPIHPGVLASLAVEGSTRRAASYTRRGYGVTLIRNRRRVKEIYRISHIGSSDQLERPKASDAIGILG
jgi:hypothetical protein